MSTDKGECMKIGRTGNADVARNGMGKVEEGGVGRRSVFLREKTEDKNK